MYKRLFIFSLIHSIFETITEAKDVAGIVFQNNRPGTGGGSAPRAIAVDNNTVILQSAVTSSSGGHQAIPSTVIVQAPPSSSSSPTVTPTQILGLVTTSLPTNSSNISAAVTSSSSSVISRVFSVVDGSTSGVITSGSNSVVDSSTGSSSVSSSHHIPVSVIPSVSFLKRKADEVSLTSSQVPNDSGSTETSSEPLDKKPRVDSGDNDLKNQVSGDGDGLVTNSINQNPEEVKQEEQVAAGDTAASSSTDKP